MKTIYHASHKAAEIPVLPQSNPAIAKQHIAQALTATQRMQLDDMEAVRAAYWNRTGPEYRRALLLLAGMDPRRNNAGINAFDAEDRAKLHRAARAAVGAFENLARCATGGAVHDSGEMGMHSNDGIAALRVN